MEMRIHFSGKKQVIAEYEGFSVATDQPLDSGGEGSAPSPFNLFLASIGTCAGVYVLGFCQKRDLPTKGIELVQKMDYDSTTHLVSKITLEIKVPPAFPAKYHAGLINAANLCLVKKHLYQPPQFEVYVSES